MEKKVVFGQIIDRFCSLCFVLKYGYVGEKGLTFKVSHLPVSLS